jgi:hypothetical protein
VVNLCDLNRRLAAFEPSFGQKCRIGNLRMRAGTGRPYCCERFRCRGVAVEVRETIAAKIAVICWSIVESSFRGGRRGNWTIWSALFSLIGQEVGYQDCFRQLSLATDKAGVVDESVDQLPCGPSTAQKRRTEWSLPNAFAKGKVPS